MRFCASFAVLSPHASAIITFGGTGNNYTTPPDGVGNYEGLFGAYLGTPISSNFMLSAAHIVGAPTQGFAFNNGTSTTTNYNMQLVVTLDDLAVWEIAPGGGNSFSEYAPLYTGNSEQGLSVVDVGRGYSRGSAVTGGWNWGSQSGSVSWGTNTIASIDPDTEINASLLLGNSGAFGGDFLQYDFDNNPSDPNECILASGDSGGGLFVSNNGVYQLAGINTAVSSVWNSGGGNYLLNSLYDEFGYYDYNSSGQLVQITSHTPMSSYATRLSSKTNLIGLADGTISSANAASYPINNDGLLTIYSNLTTGAITGGALVTVGNNGTSAKLTLAQNSGISTISSLTIGSGSTLDIANNRILINYGSGSDPIASIATWIANGYDGLSGPQIISSSIATADAVSGNSYGIGYADSADPGNPANLPSGTIEIMFTLMGDANLDGVVNAEDFTLFSQNSGHADMPWDDGDFNYDGSVNAEDFTLFAHNLGQSAVLASQAGDLEIANGVSLAGVPEPTTAGMIAISGSAILSRRRRPLRDHC